MRKYAILLVVINLIGFSCNLSAQNFSLGVKGGLSIPNLTGGGDATPLSEGYMSRTGPDFSIFGEYRISKLVSVSLGLEYSSQGGKKDKKDKNGNPQAFVDPQLTQLLANYGMDVHYFYADYKSVAKMNYLLVPVLAKFSWKLSNSRPLKFYFAVGPFAGLLLNAHQETSGSSIIYRNKDRATLPLPGFDVAQSFDAKIDIKDELRDFNFGINGFVGFSYGLSSTNSLFVEGGGNYGFISIQKDPDNGKNCTGAGVVSLGYAHSF